MVLRKKGESYTKEMLYEGLDEILKFYNKADIYISMIHCDNEFKSIFKELENNWDIKFNFSSPQEHVPNIEHKNRVLQERFCVLLYRLPFKVIPRTMIWYGALRVTKLRSYFPKKAGISKYFSPYTILNQRQIVFNKEFAHSFGDYVQAVEDNPPKNKNLLRSKDCIYLRASNLLQGGHDLMDLSTGRKIT